MSEAFLRILQQFDPRYGSNGAFPNVTVCGHNLYENENYLEVIYVGSALLFIMSLKGLSNQETASWGNVYGCLGMLAAISGAWASRWVCDEGYWLIAVALVPGAIIGTFAAANVTMIQMPQMVGLLNSFGGLASALEAIGLYLDENSVFGPNGLAELDTEERNAQTTIQTIALYLSLIVGSVTFFGSIVACLKLNGTIASKPRSPPQRTLVTMLLLASIVTFSVLADWKDYGSDVGFVFLMLAFITSAVWGVMFVLAIGGADMPVVICVLNTGSGFAGVFAGFMLANKLLVITGAFVGCSGAILSVIMCDAMNRSLWAVMVGGFGDSGGGVGAKVEGEMKEVNLDDLASMLNKSKEVIIVPGYGMAAAKAQHAIAQVTEILRNRKIKTRFAIHPVAGRLPGHMNVLLAEARVPYDIVLAMDEINQDFSNTDVVLVVGANDIVNPAAAEDPTCPIAGMPVLEVWNAKTTVVVKRGRGAGYSGVDNPLFVRDNNVMFFGSAKPRMEELAAKLLELGPVSGGGAGSMSSQAKVEKEEKPVELVIPDIHYHFGVLKDRFPGERRVALVPTVAAKMVQEGYMVHVESGAGLGAGFSDEAYKQVGCTIHSSDDGVIANSKMIFCVRPPTERLESLSGKFVVSWIGRLTGDGKQYIEAAAKKNVNVVDVTAVPRITIAQKLDCLSSQAKIAGHRAVLEAAHAFQRFMAPEITAAGKYPPCKVMVLGAGVAGLAAIGTSVALGCDVRAWDVRDVSDQVESLGGKWFSVDFKEEGAGAGGYAKESSDAFKAAQKATFHQQCKEVDIIITTAAIPGRPSPILVEEYMVDDMKPGSVIVDLGAEGGGNASVTRKGEMYVYKNKITCIGYTDMPARMAEQASTMFAQNMYNLVSHVHAKTEKGLWRPTFSFVLLGNAAHFEKHFLSNIADKEDNDIIIRSIVCSQNGEVLKMPPPPQPSPIKPTTTSAQPEGIKKVSSVGGGIWASSQFILFLVMIFLVCMAIWAPQIFVELLMVFMLGAWVGYMLVWNVQPALHTPLMSVSNAISGQVVLGGIFMVSNENTGTRVLAIAAIFIASVNVFGGFTVTHRMLGMFKKG